MARISGNFDISIVFILNRNTTKRISQRANPAGKRFITMTTEQQGFQEKLTGIRLLRQEVLLRLALIGHIRSLDPTVDLMADLTKMNRQLERLQQQLKQTPHGSEQEEAALQAIRELEDHRFQLLSQLHGDDLTAYNTWAPRYGQS